MTATPVDFGTTARVESATESPTVDDLTALRSRLLEEAQAFLSSPEVSATGYVKGIAIEHAHDALNEVARIDATLAGLTPPAKAEGEQL